MAPQLPAQFGPYSLLKLLAKGGMGEIYLARTTGISHFEKYYAVKKLLKKFARDQDVGARFIDEAKLGARLQHPNIVQVYDLGAVSDELFMATEFVDGFDLRRVLRFCHEKKKRIPLDIALFIVKEILSGLAYAHRQLDAEGQSINLIHRDISPQNVLVSFEGEVKIIDFGLAKSTQRSQETQANVLLGNFGYMSPEQARGQKLDVRTDIYSTGIVLFELVTRTKRFVDENPLRLLEMVARPTPVMPSDRAPDVPKRVDTMYAMATAPSRDERYANADAFRSDITTALHKINPHASREHLAQFLNHLFLGGKPPPAPDNDALDKSVAMQVHEIYQQAEAFRRTKEQDAQDRRLSQFSDDAPQTGSHNLMRGCRSGDALSHTDLTGDRSPADLPAVDEPDSTEIPIIASGSVVPTSGSGQPTGGAARQHVNEMPPEEISAAATSVYEAPEWAGKPTGEFQAPPAAQQGVELDLQAQIQAQLDAQASPAQPSPAQPSPAQPSPAQPSPAQPSPAQPSSAQPSSAQPSPAQPSPAEPSPAQPSPAQPSSAQPSSAQPSPAQPSRGQAVEEALPTHDTLQAIPQPDAFAPEGMVTTPGAEAFVSSPDSIESLESLESLEPVEAPLDTLEPSLDPVDLPMEALLPAEPETQPAEPLPDPASRPPDASLAQVTMKVAPIDPAARPPDPSAFSSSLDEPAVSMSTDGAVVSTVPRPEHEEEAEEPTVVVDMEGFSVGQSNLSAEAKMPPPGPHQNAFASSGGSESLIIDFDASDESNGDQEMTMRNPPANTHLPTPPEAPDDGPPSSGVRPAAAPAEGASIRPAATPGRRGKGRPVQEINPRKR